MSRAAEALYVTQPALTARIQALEKELGEVLFVRTGRGVRLTDAGRVFLPCAERAIQAIDDGRRARIPVSVSHMAAGERFGTTRPNVLLDKLPPGESLEHQLKHYMRSQAEALCWPSGVTKSWRTGSKLRASNGSMVDDPNAP